MTRLSFRFSAAILSLVVLGLAGTTAHAQQKIGYIDSDYILSNLPEYATIQQQLDRMAQTWQSELDEAKAELDEKFREYQARELLYTNEERQRRRQEILQEEEDLLLRTGLFVILI